MKKFIAFTVVLLFVFGFCSQAQRMSKKKKQITLDTIVVSAKNSEYRAIATRSWDIVHTRAVLSFNWKEKTANGKVWIDMHPYFYATDSLVLDAKGMQINDVKLKDEKGDVLAFIYENDQLKIKLPVTIPSSDTIRVYIDYKAMPYASKTGGSSAIVDDRGLYFINTDNSIPDKPQQIWTQGETESNSHWLPTFDKPNERFTARIELLVPDTMQTLSNGYCGASIKENNHIRRDIWIMDKPVQPYAYMFAIGKFIITKDEWRGREVNYYVEPLYGNNARTIFRYTPEMLEHFSNITGVTYPWNKYSQVIVRDYVSGAMENTSATLLGEFMNGTSRDLADREFEDVVSHELFHQWFGDYVTAASWSNITLNESFANYGEQLWRRHKYGKAAADRLAYEDLQKYLVYANSLDSPLVRYYYNDREDVFDPISYEKGGAILRYLNKLMGDSAFYKAMKIYLTKNALQPAEVSAWKDAVEQATGQDWSWFFNEFYFHGGHPVLDIAYNYDDSLQQLTVTVTQKDTTGYVYQLPLQSLLIYNGTREIVNWGIKNRTETYVYPYHNGIRPVVVPDEERRMPGGYYDIKKPGALLSEFIYSNTFASRRIAIAKLNNNFSDSSAQELVRLALKDTMTGIKEFCLESIQWVADKELQKKWEPMVSMLAMNDAKNSVRTDAFDVLGAWKTTSITEQMQEAILDSSYNVAGAALNAFYQVDSERAYTSAIAFLNTNPRGRLKTSMWSVIGKHASEDDISLFEKASITAYGTDKFILAYGLYIYMQRVNSDVAFEKAAIVLCNMTMNDAIKGYRLGLGGYFFSLRDFYTVSKKDSRERKEFVEKRKAILQNYIDKVIAAETDEGNLKRYKEMLK